MNKRQLISVFSAIFLGVFAVSGCTSQQAPPPTKIIYPGGSSEPLGMQLANMDPTKRAKFMAEITQSAIKAREASGQSPSGAKGNPKAYAMILQHMSPEKQKAYLATHSLPPPPPAH
jgi:hypothetical protein